MNSQIYIIASITLLSAFIYTVRPKVAVILSSFIMLLMHKELFSIYQWDLLPIRFFILGMGIGFFINLIRKLRKSGLLEIRDYLKTTFFEDRFFLLLLLVLAVKLVSASVAGSNLFHNQFILFFTEVVVLYVAMKFAYSESKSKEKFVRDVIIGFLVVGSFSIAFAYFQMLLFNLNGIKIGSIWPVPKNLPRLGSLFWDVNHFGGYLIILIPILFSLLFAIHRLIYRIAIAFGLTISLITLFLTQSRSSWLGLAIAMVVCIFLLLTKKYFKPVLIFFVLTILMAVVFVTYMDVKDLGIRQKVASYMHYRLDSTDTHVMLLEGAVQVFLENPLLGVGPGNFDTNFRKTETSIKYFEREPKLKTQKVPPHSVWGEILSETGYIGFASYLLLVGFLLITLLKNYYIVENRFGSYVSLGFFISILSILVAGIFYSYNLEFYWFVMILGYLCTLAFSNLSPTFTEVFKWASKYSIIYICILFAISAFYMFVNLGGVTLIEWDEAIYGKIAKNMYISGDWLNLYWIKIGEFWYEKPPLYMWLTTLTFYLTGPNEFGVRLWPAIMGVGSVLVTFLMGRTLFGKLAGFTSALVLASTAHFLYYSRNGQLDVPVTFFIVSSIYTYVLAIRADTNSSRKKYLLFTLAGTFMGLGVMTKAVVGLIPLAILILNEVINSVITKKRPNIFGLLLFIVSSIAIFAPWYVYSYVTHGMDFFDESIKRHIFDRGTQGLGHAMPLLWYIEVLKVSLRIWMAPLIVGIPFILYRFRSSEAIRVSAISALFIFVFFSLSKDKMLWYIVPVYPFIAIVIGGFISEVITFIVSNLKIPSFTVERARIYFVVIFALFIPYYIVSIRDKIFFEDENKDIVELIKVHNEMYSGVKEPSYRLRYATVPDSVILFYSDFEPEQTDKGELIDFVKKTTPEKTYTFLITENRFYEMRGKIKDEFVEPYDLRIKASSGKYVIARSYSSAEVYMEKRDELYKDIFALKTLRLTNLGLSDFDSIKLIKLGDEYNKIVNLLNEKGYPTANPISID